MQGKKNHSVLEDSIDGFSGTGRQIHLKRKSIHASLKTYTHKKQ